jgi:hypothetical protein
MEKLTPSEVLTQDQKSVELEEMDIVIGIPKEAARILITADVFVNDKQLSVTRVLNPSDIFNSRKDFLDLVGDEDVYVLTEEGKKLASKL